MKSSTLLLLITLSPLPLLAAEVELPEYPWWPNNTMAVDDAHLSAKAGEYCASGQSDPVQFYLGWLPLQGFDVVCPATPEERDLILGDLYLSGYFGGLWLRDALDDVATAAVLDEVSRAAALARTTTVVERAVFAALEAQVGHTVTRGEEGSPGQVLLASRAGAPSLLGIYGYNLGYLQVLFENPSPGATTPPDALVCGDYLLDCSSPYQDLAILETFSPAISNLSTPASFRWAQMDDLVVQYGESAVAEGRAVWEDILADSTLDPAAYDPLIDLSVKFLLVSDAAALAALQGWATTDDEVARCGQFLQAGLVVWSGSYFMGLASKAPAGTFPTLTCSP